MISVSTFAMKSFSAFLVWCCDCVNAAAVVDMAIVAVCFSAVIVTAVGNDIVAVVFCCNRCC